MMMKKRLICLGLVLCMALSLVACGSATTRMSYTYNIDNGDKIKVKLETTDGHKMTADLPFTITLDEESLSQGTFIQGDAYDYYVSTAETSEEVEILDRGTKDGNEYVFWSYAGEEFNYVIKIADSQTAVLLGNPISQESAEDCFQRLIFEVD